MIDTAQNLKEYKKRLKKALRNQFVRNTLGTFATAYKEARGRVFEGMDLPGLKAEIAHGKDAGLAHLMEIYEEFKAKAEAAGARVHLAKTAHEANEIIAGIAKERSGQTHRQVQVHDRGGDLSQRSIWKRRASRWWRRTWANGSSSCGTKVLPTW